jgi:competence protein ComEA
MWGVTSCFFFSPGREDNRCANKINELSILTVIRNLKEGKMKKICLLLAVAFVCVTGFTALPGDSVAAATKTETVASQTLSGKVNINTADEAILSALPGIGPKTAVAIISYRTEHGKFQAIQDLQQVKGIGEKKFAKIEPYLEKI